MTDDRFWAKVEKTAACWLWTGSRSQHGHGRLRRGFSKLALWAHRYSWELTNGPIPDGLKVLHHCDNPPCVNPDHLFLGTQGDNMRDMAAKGRETHQKRTHCPKGHPLAGDNLHPATFKRGHRRCLTCTREQSSASQKRRWPEIKQRKHLRAQFAMASQRDKAGFMAR